MRPGDIGVVYLTQDRGGDSAIGGIIRFSGPLTNAEAETLYDQLYPLRIPFEPILIPRDPVPFRPLVPAITFIRKKDAWGTYFQGQAVKQLEPSDLATLTAFIEDEE